MSEPKTMAELIAQVTAKFTAGTNLPVDVQHESSAYADTSPEVIAGTAGGEAQESTVEKPMSGATGSQNSCGGQNPLSQTQILHLLELGLANPSKQEDRR